MNRTDELRMSKWLGLVIAILVLVLGIRIALTELAIRDSGTLSVTTPAPGTALTVTQGGHTATYIGSGTTQVRLRAGVYLVGAAVSGQRTTKPVTIERGRTSHISMNPSTTANNTFTPTPTGFINFDTLVNSGLTSDQETSLEQLFTNFRPSAQVFTIDPQSIVVTVPNSASGSTTFTMTFNVTVDTVVYQATIQYTGSDFVQLTLTDSTGAQVYQGYPQPTET